jgi:hypothetical protein
MRSIQKIRTAGFLSPNLYPAANKHQELQARQTDHRELNSFFAIRRSLQVNPNSKLRESEMLAGIRG